MAQVKPTTITTTTNIIIDPNTTIEANQTEQPLGEFLASLSASVLKKGTKRTRSPSSDSSTSTSSSNAPKQQKKKRHPKWQPLAIKAPTRSTFHGSITINPRDEALQYAKTAYKTQFDAESTPPNTTWHVFWADGSTYHQVAGSTGTGVVYSADRVDNFVDRGFALQDLSEIQHLEMFGIGAALKIALERILGTGREEREVVMGGSEFEEEWSSSSSSSSSSEPASEERRKRKKRVKQKRRRGRKKARKEDEEEEKKKKQEEEGEGNAEEATPTPTPKHKVSVFSDSQSAITTLRSLSNQTGPGREALDIGMEGRTPGRAVTRTVARISKRLADLGVEVELHWIPGHTDHVAHKRVDLIAKAAARHAANFLNGKVERTSRDKVVQVVDSGFLELELP